jgi:microcystin-dependent protein
MTSLTPAGMIAPYGGTSAPSGWVLCDGSGYPINNLNYANLYSVIGNTYGFYSAGSANYFQVPDLGSTLYTNTNTNSPTSLGVNYIIKL